MENLPLLIYAHNKTLAKSQNIVGAKWVFVLLKSYNTFEDGI